MMQPDPLSHLRLNFEHLLRSIGRLLAPEQTECSAACTRCLTGLGHPFANLVLAGEQTHEAFVAMLGELEQWAGVSKAPVGLVLFPDIGLEGRAGWAEARGWIQLDRMPGMWLQMGDDFRPESLPEGVSIRRVAGEEMLAHLIRLMAEGYPVPLDVADFFMRGIQLAGEAGGGSIVNLLATVDSEPAACSSVCVRDGVAGIYCVATLERFRGRGLGRAVTRAAALEGKRLGARHALLHATAMGEPVYRRIGFEERCRIPVYGFGF